MIKRLNSFEDDIPCFNFLKDNPKIITQRSGTLGYQPKAYYNNSNTFVKCQYESRGILYDDWKVEILATQIGEQLGINTLTQNHCKVVVSEKMDAIDGVYSPYFLKGRESFVSYKRLLEVNNRSTDIEYEFNKLSSFEKMRWMIEGLVKMCEISRYDAFSYFIDLAVVDLLVCNVDRHFHNFGVILRKNEFKLPPIFDCGMGMFTYSSDFVGKSLAECLRQTYIEPYSEDPFVLFDELDKEFNLKGYLYGASIRLNELDLINDNGKEYFIAMCNKMGIKLIGGDKVGTKNN